MEVISDKGTAHSPKYRFQFSRFGRFDWQVIRGQQRRMPGTRQGKGARGRGEQHRCLVWEERCFGRWAMQTAAVCLRARFPGMFSAALARLW